MKPRFILAILGLPLLLGCARSAQSPPAAPQSDVAQSTNLSIKLTSAAFQGGEAIPRQYTCDGVNVSPPIEWSGVPKTAKTIAIIADDPDAPSGTFVHWVLYNLPAENIGLVENVPATDNLKAGGFQGEDDFKKVGYGGPCPTEGT